MAVFGDVLVHGFSASLSDSEEHFNCNDMIIASDRLEIKKLENRETRPLSPYGRIQQLHRQIHFIPIHSFYHILIITMLTH